MMRITAATAWFEKFADRGEALATMETGSAGAKLRGQLQAGQIVAAGCFDGISARIAEHVGFGALHVSGSAVEASQLGEPDMGLTTLTELAAHVSRISDAVGLPAIVDIDTGFGGLANVDRTIRQLIRAGAGGVHIEDQTFPKKSPTVSGRTVVSRAEAVARIEVAVAARTDPDFVIVGRSDAEIISIQETVERCNLFLDAGADVAFPMCMEFDGVSVNEMTPERETAMHRYFVENINGPVMGMCYPVRPGAATLGQIKDTGLGIVILPTLSFQAGLNAMHSVLRQVLEDGDAVEHFQRNPDQFPGTGTYELLGIDRYLQMDRHYADAR